MGLGTRLGIFVYGEPARSAAIGHSLCSLVKMVVTPSVTSLMMVSLSMSAMLTRLLFCVSSCFYRGKDSNHSDQVPPTSTGVRIATIVTKCLLLLQG